MANNYLVNPIRIDTAMTSSFKALTSASIGAFNTLLIKKVYWLNPATIGDTVSIIDPNSSEELMPLRAEVAGQSILIDFTPQPELWADFEVNQISSGVLYIYLG